MPFCFGMHIVGPEAIFGSQYLTNTCITPVTVSSKCLDEALDKRLTSGKILDILSRLGVQIQVMNIMTPLTIKSC